MVIGWNKIKTTTEVVEYTPRPKEDIKAEYAERAVSTTDPENAEVLIRAGGLTASDLALAKEKLRAKEAISKEWSEEIKALG